uniref:Uncharacterized protein n=1 Tax=Lepeophtheirus salmonis TaxID=72036 RepID=A0A0K2UUM6_LEPSM
MDANMYTLSSRESFLWSYVDKKTLVVNFYCISVLLDITG